MILSMRQKLIYNFRKSSFTKKVCWKVALGNYMDHFVVFDLDWVWRGHNNITTTIRVIVSSHSHSLPHLSISLTFSLSRCEMCRTERIPMSIDLLVGYVCSSVTLLPFADFSSHRTLALWVTTLYCNLFDWRMCVCVCLWECICWMHLLLQFAPHT